MMPYDEVKRENRTMSWNIVIHYLPTLQYFHLLGGEATQKFKNVHECSSD